MNPDHIFKSVLTVFFHLILCAHAFSCAPKKSIDAHENSENNFMQTGVQNIIGGQDLSPATANSKSKYSVVALIDVSASQNSTICTGTFITNNIILTAAHCVPENPSDLIIYFGNSVFTDQKSIEIPALKIIRHSGYEVGQNDLALVQISTSQISKNKVIIEPVVLMNETNFSNMDLMIYGYGVNQIENSTTDSNDDLQGAGQLRKIKISSKLISGINQFIFIDQSQGLGACHGDSGGPAFVLNQKNKYELVGVASGVKQSNDKNECTDESVYTNLNSYGSWIYESIVKFDQQN